MRAIDADAFKEYITGACEDMKHLFNDGGAVAKLITESFCKDIDEQPTIQLEPHWIPVTERLPEKSGRYFVTERIYHINDKEHTGGFILKTDFAEYSATEKKWRRAQALVVVAWMDNEPYKGVTE